MKYIDTLREGMRISEVYLCKSKQIALTKAGKEYGNLVLQDKTGTIDSKIWDLHSPGVSSFETMDYVHVDADVTVFQGSNQLNVKRIRRADEGEYEAADYLPVSARDIGKMYEELLQYVKKIKNPYLSRLAESFFTDDQEFAKAFRFHSAAKSVHHSFVGENDYTDDGQLLGHILIGIEMVTERIRQIPGFPPRLESELKHCIAAHHGELEYGSPKKPALLEAMALNFADNTDAKMETMIEALRASGDGAEWVGYNRLLETNIRRTTEE